MINRKNAEFVNIMAFAFSTITVLIGGIISNHLFEAIIIALFFFGLITIPENYINKSYWKNK